ncbi:MAG: hypothetical protein ACTHLH_07765 [Solirubrobacterales bacterium]
MYKRLMAGSAALAALAVFALAPLASASPVLTENGTAVATGSSFTGKNTGELLFTGALNASCNLGEFAGTVTANTGTKIKGEVPVGGAKIGGTGASGDCTSSLGSVQVSMSSKVCTETVTGSDNVSVTGCGANIVFTATITGSGVCKYSTASMAGAFVTNADATLKLSEQEFKRTEGGAFCPSSGKLDYTGDETTTNGTTLFIS